MEFDFAVFEQWLITEQGRTVGTANATMKLARACFRAGQDPHDNERFAVYVEQYAQSTRSPRRSAWRWLQRWAEIGPVLPSVGPNYTRIPAEQTSQLKDFEDYLENQVGLSPGSVVVYASAVRMLIRALGSDPTAIQIETYLKTRSLSYRQRFPRCWDLWARFHNGQVADMSTADNLPDGVCVVAWVFAARIGLQLTHLRTLAWKDLREHEDGTLDVSYVPDPQDGRYYRQRVTDTTVVAVLRDWSLPFDADAPVLPSDRGGLRPMSRKQLQRTVNRGATLIAAGHVLRRPGISVVPGQDIPPPPMDVPWQDRARLPGDMKTEAVTPHDWNDPIGG